MDKEKEELEVTILKRQLDRKAYKRAALTGLFTNKDSQVTSFELVQFAGRIADMCMEEDANHNNTSN